MELVVKERKLLNAHLLLCTFTYIFRWILTILQDVIPEEEDFYSYFYIRINCGLEMLDDFPNVMQ